jgi:hypothetical protein
MAVWSQRSGGTVFSTGPWKNVQNRYLGLRFLIEGKVHYGWARLNVTIAHHQVNAVLTGYAYETVPHKAIVAGKTKGSHLEASLKHGRPLSVTALASRPATLGLLATGAPGLTIWRREESVDISE